MQVILLTYETSLINDDGKNVRDWLYVIDHCDAFIRLRPNTLSRFIGTAGMKGKVNRVEAR